MIDLIDIFNRTRDLGVCIGKASLCVEFSKMLNDTPLLTSQEIIDYLIQEGQVNTKMAEDIAKEMEIKYGVSKS